MGYEVLSSGPEQVTAGQSDGPVPGTGAQGKTSHTPLDPGRYMVHVGRRPRTEEISGD